MRAGNIPSEAFNRELDVPAAMLAGTFGEIIWLRHEILTKHTMAKIDQTGNLQLQRQNSKESWWLNVASFPLSGGVCCAARRQSEWSQAANETRRDKEIATNSLSAGQPGQNDHAEGLPKSTQ
jgi:hypothetical protein